MCDKVEERAAGCCEPSEQPPDCAKAACCDDGSWSCPVEDGGTVSYVCGNQVLEEPPSGTLCKKGGSFLCNADVRICPGGFEVTRDPANDCEFFPCPEFSCCNPDDEPGERDCDGKGHACCPDGTWTCSIDDGETFVCSGEETKGPFPQPCKCCDPKDFMYCFIGTAKCCDDGTWSCPSNDVYTCAVGETTKPSGVECEVVGPIAFICCDPHEEPGKYGNGRPREGYRCCPDGTWTVSIGDGKTFGCGGGLTTGPFSEACPCCDPSAQPDCSEAACCYDGSWSCPSIVDDGTLSYSCGDLVQQDPPSGIVCKKEEPVDFICCDPNEEPGKYGNGRPREGYQCCPDGTWTFSIGDGTTFSCAGELTTGPFSKACPCCDHSEQLACDAGNAACCEDGSWSCPIIADDGTLSYSCGDLVLEDLPSGIVCKKEEPTDFSCCDPNKEPGKYGNGRPREGYQCCPDGTWTVSIGDGKTFMCGGQETQGPFSEACPCCILSEQVDCDVGNAACCEDGSWSCPIDKEGKVYSCGDVELKDRPSGIVCKKEIGGCPEDLLVCPDGITSVKRDPNSGCEFAPCPEFSCCDPSSEPGKNGNPICFEGHQCCPDGTWSCSIGDGKTFGCGGEQTTGPFSKACPCCDLLEITRCQYGTPSCCEDGTWTCPTEEVGTGYVCGDAEVTNPRGVACPFVCWA